MCHDSEMLDIERSWPLENMALPHSAVIQIKHAFYMAQCATVTKQKRED